MANRAKLFERQKELGDEIVSIRTKLSLKNIRLTRIPEVEKNLQQLKAEFEANNSTLLTHGITSEDYFEKSYFSAIQNIIAESKELLEEQCKQKEVVQQPEQPSKQPSMQSTTSTHQKTTLRIDETKKVDINNDQVEAEDLREEFAEKVDWMRNWISELPTIVSHASNEQLALKTQLLTKRFISLEDVYKKLRCLKNSKDVRNLMEEIEIEYFKALEFLAESVKNNQREQNQMPIKTTEGFSNLGKIEIPEFYGDINNWAPFHDMFKSLVHNCKYLSNVEKMYRLMTALKGEARKLVQHLKVTDVNYHVAFEILKQRYENRRLLFTNQVDILLDQPMVNSESSSSVKQLLDTTNSCIYALKGMDIQIEDAEPFIARIVIRKLDNDGLRYYEQNVKKTKEIQSLDDVLGFLEQQVQALEAVTKRPGNKFHKKLGDSYKVSHNICATQQECLYCNIAGHLTSSCRKFLALQIAERKRIAFHNRLCYTCINHKFDKKCQNKTKCCYCGKGHHKLLHIDEVKSQETKPGTSKSMMTKDNRTTTLLATAQVKVRAANGELITLRALIDQGSQITGLSEEASQILALPKIKCKTNIKGLGSTAVAASKAKVKLIIQPRFSSKQVITTEALILPSISGPQPDQSFKIDLNQWDNYVLADPMFNKSDRIDLVIGADIFSNILEEGVMKKDGVLAQSTKFGWILSGVLKTNVPTRKVLSAVTNLERFWESEEDSFVTRFTYSSPSSQLLQNPKQLEEKYKENFVAALTPPLNLLKKIPVTVKSMDSLPESTSKEAMKENRVENKTELFGMQELDDQFIKSVEVSGLNLQPTSTETTPKEVDSMSKTEKIPRERPERQGEEGRPLPGPGRGAGFVAVSKRASVVSMVGKIPPLPQQLEERPQSEPDWDAEEGQFDTPKNSEGTPKRECMEHDQRELPIPSEKSGPSACLWSTEWHKGDDGSGPNVGYERGPPGPITHHPPALMNFPVKPPCSFHEGPIPPLLLNKRNMTYTDPNILKKQQAAQASAVTTANQKWHPYRIILDIGISGKDDAKRLLNEVKQQIGEELKAEAIKTDTKDDIKADIKDDVSSLSTLDEDSQNPIETNDIKPKDEVEDTTDIKPSIEDTPTDAINVDSLQALACMQVYQCKFEMEMLFLQENKLNLQKYAKNSQTNKSSFVTAATPSKLSSTIGILPALPTSFLKSPKPPPEVSNNIVDANREAIKITISPMKLHSKPAIFNTALSEELDRRIKGVDDNDEIEFTEKLVKPAKEVAIVKPMMETQLSDSQRQHCTPKI